jgi:DNA-binding response OmpR family regulator
MASKKILIADDDQAIVESLEMVLEMADYTVKSTVDGRVIPMMKKEKPDLLLLDIWMSGTDGREICKKLKKNKKTKDIPIIMISASRDIKKSTEDAGADDFLEKPFEVDSLLEKIQKYLGNN